MNETQIRLGVQHIIEGVQDILGDGNGAFAFLVLALVGILAYGSWKNQKDPG